MKTMTNEELKAHGETLPMGSTYDAAGRELAYRDSDGFWCERTYDADGRDLTFRASTGYWRERTYDADGRALSYRNSNGVSGPVLAEHSGYTLVFDTGERRYIAGCRNFSREEALEHWGRPDSRAKRFRSAIMDFVEPKGD